MAAIRAKTTPPWIANPPSPKLKKVDHVGSLAEASPIANDQNLAPKTDIGIAINI